MNINYPKSYLVYKKLPIINFIGTMIAVIVWGIIDWCELITAIGDLEFVGFILWLLIGFVAATVNFSLTCVLNSPTILRTDTTLKIHEEIKKKEPNNQ